MTPVARARIATAIAGASLLLAAYAAFEAHRARVAVRALERASAGASAEWAPKREVDALRVSVAACMAALGAQRHVAAGASGAASSLAPPGTSAADGRAATAPPSAASGPTLYVRFRPPSPALAITQSDNGALAVKNSDPALAGRVLEVEATRADGAVERVTILVPAPGR
jgi:hypothetical protein